MKYSFVLPAYKARFFREVLDSILAQTYKEFELIIVNDASPEDLDSIVRSYNDTRIRYYVNSENIGGKDLVAQWNHCLEYAKGEYIILASDDDVYHPLYLEKMNVLVDKYPEVNVFRPRIKWIDSHGDTINTDIEYKERMSQLEFSILWFQGRISKGIPFYLFKKNVLKDMGGFVNFPTAWFSDDATVIKLSKNDIIIGNDILFSFRDSGINISYIFNSKKLLYEKICATDMFYNWFINEIKLMVCRNEDDIKNIRMVRSAYLYRRNDHIIGQIQRSLCARNIIRCWIFLTDVKFLRNIDRIKIIYRTFIRNKFKRK